MSNESVDVLVVGAGPTGLMMASELARHGVSHRLIERLSEPQRLAKAVGIMPRSLEVLEEVGCLEAFMQHGQAAQEMVTWVGPTPALTLSFEALSTPHPIVLCQEQWRTEAILTEHLERLGGRVERGAELTSLAQDDDGVRAVVERAGTSEALQAAYLVGCDGAHSAVRHALDFDFPGAAYPQDFLLFHGRIDWEVSRNHVVTFLSPAGVMFASPLPGDTWLMIADLAGEQTAMCQDGEPTLEDVQGILSERVALEARASAPVWSAFFRVHHRQVARYSQGRVFLAGDAAHIHSPFGGQGMNTGFQDAYNLAWKLAMVRGHGASNELLESYHAERHPVGEKVLALTHQLQTTSSLRQPVLRGLRDAMLRCMGHLEVVGHHMAGQIGETLYTYRHGPLAAEHCDPGFHVHHDARHPGFRDCHHFMHGPHAGARAPDAALDGTRVFELLRGPRFTLMLFEGTHPSPDDHRDLVAVAAELTAALPLPLATVVVQAVPGAEESATEAVRTVHDADQDAHHTYGARGQCLYLVRPDGYVAYRSQPVVPERVERFVRERLGVGETAAPTSA